MTSRDELRRVQESVSLREHMPELEDRSTGLAPTCGSLGYAESLGTCGEIVQGQIEAGSDFLVTLPVPVISAAIVALDPFKTGVTATPAHKTKAAEAVRRTLARLGAADLGGEVRVVSQLPEGKGMASSSADIVASIRATGDALHRDVSAELISEIAVSIEPSDAVMYAPLVVVYDHRCGRLLERFGYMPAASIVIVDFGARVDTVEFNKIPKNYSAAEMALLHRAYLLGREGIQEGNLSKVGQAGIMSARVNQRLLYKPGLEALIAASAELGADGVVVAHSGSVAGILFKPGHHGVKRMPAALSRVGLRPESVFVTASLPSAQPAALLPVEERPQ